MGKWDYSSTGDEWYTLKENADDLANHIVNITGKIWLPFNDTDSEIKKALELKGFECIATEGDFFLQKVPAGVTAIVSNPPYSKKKEIMQRIKELGLAYALFFPTTWLNDGVPFDFGNQMLFWRKRVQFKNGYDGSVRYPRASSFVLSNGILDKELIIIDNLIRKRNYDKFKV